MFFVKTLKNQYAPEDFLAMLAREQWTGGTFKIVSSNAALGGMNYIVFENYEDPKFAVSISCYSPRFNKVGVVKAVVTDITGLEAQVVDDLKYNAAARVGGQLGAKVLDIASGDAAKRKRAKALAKTTNKELVAFLEKYNP